MCTNQNVHLTIFQLFQNPTHIGCLTRTAQIVHPTWEILEAFLKCLIMLISQHSCRHKYGHLFVVRNSLEGSSYGHFSLSKTYISTNQSVHRTLTLHVSCTVEDASTKDTTGDWVQQEVTAVNFDISTSALVRSDETIESAVAAQALNDLENIYEAGGPVKFQIANVSGDNQRTKGAIIVSGSVILTQLTINGPNKQTATYDAQMNGWGAYTVGA